MLVVTQFGGRIPLDKPGLIRSVVLSDYLTRSTVNFDEIARWKDETSGRVRYGGMPYHDQKDSHIDGVLTHDVEILRSLGVEHLYQENFTALLGYRYKTGRSLADFIRKIIEANCRTTPNLAHEPGLIPIVGLPDSGKSHFFNTLRGEHSDITFIDTDTARLFWFAGDLIGAEPHTTNLEDPRVKCQIPYSDMAHYIFRLAFRVVANRLSEGRLVITSGLATANHADEVIFLNNKAMNYQGLLELPVPDEQSAAAVGMNFFSKSDQIRGNDAQFGALHKLVERLNRQVQQRVMYNGEFGTYPWRECPQILDASEMPIIGNPLMDKTALFEVVVGYANYFQAFNAGMAMATDNPRLPELHIIDSVWRDMQSPQREEWIREQFASILSRRTAVGGLFGVSVDGGNLEGEARP